MKCKGIRLATLLALFASICTLSCGEEPIGRANPTSEAASASGQTSEDPALSNTTASVPAPNSSSGGTVSPSAPTNDETAAPNAPSATGDGVPTSDLPQATGGSEIVGAEDEGTSAEPIMVLSGGIPCDVKEILNDGCSKCHSASPAFGAPMALETYEDLMAPAITDPSRSVYDLILERAQDQSRPMPPAPYERLDAPQLQALTGWRDSGFPTSAESCELTPPDAFGGDDFFGDLPTGERCNLDLKLTANDNGGGYQVPMVDDHYECFYFDAPDTDVLQITGTQSIIDDERTLHHWLLYYTERTDVVAGTHESCNGVHPEDTLLAGWAPGGPTYNLPEDVGLEVPMGPNTHFIVEFHYNNVARHPDSVDQSGVHLCATDTTQEHTAAVHWLGTENIFLLPGESQGVSTCTPTAPVTILSVTPHLHELGVRSSIIINRADGTQETLLDKPFDFNTQIGYETLAKLMPGDTLTSTCYWNNTKGTVVGFGEGTNDEMCYLFAMAYPIGAMNTGGDLLGVGAIGGINKCMH